MGTGEIRPVGLACVVSTVVLVFALVGVERWQGPATVESEEPEPKPEMLSWLEEEALEYQALLASLSYGVRAKHEGLRRERAEAWRKKRERAEAEHERNEAAYSAFIKAHLRRLAEQASSE